MNEYSHNSLGSKVFSHVLFICSRFHFSKMVTISPISLALLQYDLAMPIERYSLITPPLGSVTTCSVQQSTLEVTQLASKIRSYKAIHLLLCLLQPYTCHPTLSHKKSNYNYIAILKKPHVGALVNCQPYE